MAQSVRHLAALVATGAVLALPASASALLPVTKDHTIVPGKSIGGVAVGMRKGQAISLWGSKPRCLPPSGELPETCRWEPPGSATGEGGRIAVINGKVVVVGVSISSLMSASDIRELKSYKTVKGIHIGSTKAAVSAKYPGVSVPKGEAGSPFQTFCTAACTWFGGYGSTIDRISVAIHSKVGLR